MDLLFLNEYLKFLIPHTIKINRYKQKPFGVLNNFSACKGVLRPDSLGTAVPNNSGGEPPLSIL